MTLNAFDLYQRDDDYLALNFLIEFLYLYTF